MTAVLDRELAGLDALELALPKRQSRARRGWSRVWPPVAATVIFTGLWQLLVWSGWKPEYILPSPFTVMAYFRDNPGILVESTLRTLWRGIRGFAFAVFVGTVVGVTVARFRIVRVALGSMITGLQTMPSVAWTPLAIVLFEMSERAVFFVVVLGAAPSVANGLLQGIDQVPPILIRAGRVLGARGFSQLRHVILPAALPTFVSGLKQGWAFAWRALLGAELIVTIAGAKSLGQQLEMNRSLSDYAGMYAVMVAIFVLGVVIDKVLFSYAETSLRRRYGLIDAASD